MVIGTGIDEGCGGHGSHDGLRRRPSSVATVGLAARAFLLLAKRRGRLDRRDRQ